MQWIWLYWVFSVFYLVRHLCCSFYRQKTPNITLQSSLLVKVLQHNHRMNSDWVWKPVSSLYIFVLFCPVLSVSTNLFLSPFFIITSLRPIPSRDDGMKCRWLGILWLATSLACLPSGWTVLKCLNPVILKTCIDPSSCFFISLNSILLLSVLLIKSL